MDLDIIFKIAGVGIIVAVLNMILKKSEREEYGLIVTIAGLIVVLLVIIDEIASLFETVKSVFGFCELWILLKSHRSALFQLFYAGCLIRIRTNMRFTSK